MAQRTVSGRTMDARDGVMNKDLGKIAAVYGKGRAGKNLTARGQKTNIGDMVLNPTELHSFVPGTDPARFGGHNAYSKTPFPVFGPANTGDMPNIQRAFAKGKANSGITQLLPNITQGSKNTQGPRLTTPQLSRVTIGEKGGFTPGELVNLQRESGNQIQEANDQRTQQAMDFSGGAMDRVRKALGDQFYETRKMGRQAMGRIDEQEQQNLSASQANLIQRGLGNSNISDTIGHLYRREANDARLGVDEAKARANMGIEDQQAQYEYNHGGRISSLLTGQPLQDPSMQAIGGMGQAKADNNVWKSLGLSSAGTLIGGAAGGAGSALGGLAGGAVEGIGGGIGALGGLIAGLF